MKGVWSKEEESEYVGEKKEMNQERTQRSLGEMVKGKKHHSKLAAK